MISWYSTRFTLKVDYNTSYQDHDDMMPYERDIEIALIMDRLKKLEELEKSPNENVYEPKKWGES